MALKTVCVSTALHRTQQ